MRIMKQFFTPLAGLASLAFALGANSANATVLLSVDGDIDDFVTINSDAAPSFNFGQASAVTFTLERDVQNLTFSASIDCLSCDGFVFLNKGVAGLGVETGDLLAIGEFDETSNTLFETNSNSILDFDGTTKFDLVAGIYTFGFLIDEGSASWFANSAATVNESLNATYAFDLFSSDANPTFPPRNNFDIASNDGFQLFSIEGQYVPEPPNEIPVPGALVLMLSGLGALGAFRKRGA